MVLPIINGPCEGCLIVGLFYIITAINGIFVLNFNYIFIM